MVKRSGITSPDIANRTIIFCKKYHPRATPEKKPEQRVEYDFHELEKQSPRIVSLVKENLFLRERLDETRKYLEIFERRALEWDREEARRAAENVQPDGE